MTATPSDPPQRSRFFPWPGLIFVLMAINFTVVGITIWASATDGGFVIEPGYDRKAERFQETLDARARAASLGWRIEAVEPRVAEPLRLALVDASGQALAGARIDAVLFHHAAAGLRRTETLRESTPGVYETAFAPDRGGTWRAQLSILRGFDAVELPVDVLVAPREASGS